MTVRSPPDVFEIDFRQHAAAIPVPWQKNWEAMYLVEQSQQRFVFLTKPESVAIIFFGKSTHSGRCSFTKPELAAVAVPSRSQSWQRSICLNSHRWRVILWPDKKATCGRTCDAGAAIDKKSRSRSMRDLDRFFILRLLRCRWLDGFGEYNLSTKNCSVIISFCCRHPPWMARVGEWLSLVEHLVRDQGVGGSNPLSPTKVSG